MFADAREIVIMLVIAAVAGWHIMIIADGALGRQDQICQEHKSECY